MPMRFVRLAIEESLVEESEVISELAPRRQDVNADQHRNACSAIHARSADIVNPQLLRLGNTPLYESVPLIANESQSDHQ